MGQHTDATIETNEANAREGKECGTDNLFALFDDRAEWRNAETEIKKACDRAAAKIHALQKRYNETGAEDTMSREAIADYIHAMVNGSEDTTGDWFRINRAWPSMPGLTWREVRDRLIARGDIKE
jgi:hypothetical protein